MPADDQWEARLEDGTIITESDIMAQTDGRSAWIQFCSMCRKRSLTIAEVSASLGQRRITIEAQGHSVCTGQAFEFLFDFGSGKQEQTRYRWVVREAPEHWEWRITDGRQVWQVTTSAGSYGYEEMPSPREFAYRKGQDCTGMITD
jgi:hypothetical protein